MSQHRVALILSGSGHIDGAEITEAVSLMIALTQSEYQIDYYAPDRNQLDVVNHQTDEVVAESRNILVEAARIARGNVRPLTDLNPREYDALAFPGGFGVVKNFTTFLSDGENATLTDDLIEPLRVAIELKKPIVAICAAPLVLALTAKTFGLSNVSISFGDEKNAQHFLNVTEKWGVSHHNTAPNEAYIDTQNHFITSGAYMYGDSQPYLIYQGAYHAIELLNSLIR